MLIKVLKLKLYLEFLVGQVESKMSIPDSLGLSVSLNGTVVLDQRPKGPEVQKMREVLRSKSLGSRKYTWVVSVRDTLSFLSSGSQTGVSCVSPNNRYFVSILPRSPIRIFGVVPTVCYSSVCKTLTSEALSSSQNVVPPKSISSPPSFG